MQLDLDLGPEEVAIQDAVARFCDYRLGKDANSRRSVRFSRDLWREFAALGILEASHGDNPGGVLQACVAMEILGEAAFPGPLAQSLASAAVLGAEDWARVAAGEFIAAFGTPPVLAWGAEADIMLVCAWPRVFRLIGPAQPVATLADMASGRIGDMRGVDLGPAEAAMARYDMAAAAYVQGAGRTAVQAAADHARTRRQFGKSIGEFQAVAFPLAEALMGLNAARIITRFAAMAIDRGRADAPALAAAARLSASRAALKGCYAAHQTFGASGQLVDGPVAWLSRPVQQMAVLNRDLSTLRAGLPLSVVGALDLDAWAS